MCINKFLLGKTQMYNSQNQYDMSLGLGFSINKDGIHTKTHTTGGFDVSGITASLAKTAGQSLWTKTKALGSALWDGAKSIADLTLHSALGAVETVTNFLVTPLNAEENSSTLPMTTEETTPAISNEERVKLKKDYIELGLSEEEAEDLVASLSTAQNEKGILVASGVTSTGSIPGVKFGEKGETKMTAEHEKSKKKNQQIRNQKKKPKKNYNETSLNSNSVLNEIRSNIFDSILEKIASKIFNSKVVNKVFKIKKFSLVGEVLSATSFAPSDLSHLQILDFKFENLTIDSNFFFKKPPLENTINFDFENVNNYFEHIDNTNTKTIYFNKRKKGN